MRGQNDVKLKIFREKVEIVTFYPINLTFYLKIWLFFSHKCYFISKIWLNFLTKVIFFLSQSFNLIAGKKSQQSFFFILNVFYWEKQASIHKCLCFHYLKCFLQTIKESFKQMFGGFSLRWMYLKPVNIFKSMFK